MRFNDQFKKLDDVGSVGRGKSKHRPRNDRSLFGGNYPFIQTGDVRKAEYYLTEYSQTYNEKGLAQSKLWDKGTLCITIAANIAETAVLGIKACFPDSIIGFVPDKEKSDVRFIKYCLETYKLQMQSISKGATQDNLSLEKLRSINFSIPDISVQKNIADVLYNYDKLIENNTKRISILEQMAEQLYKEWFVRMRFPNYDKTKLVKGLPQGWSLSKLDDIAIIKKGKVITKKTITEGLVPVVAGGLSPAYYHNKANTISPTITISASGANSGFVNLYYENIWASDCSYIDTKASLYQFFVYMTLKVRQKEVYHLQKGSAQPHVYPIDLQRLEIIRPTDDLLNYFEKIVRPIFSELENLTNQNINLRKTRDLLLPRLISGKLQIQPEKRQILTDQKAITPFYQKQILAHIIKKQEEYNVPQGEMVLAKNAYLLEALYGVNTGFIWKNWHYGTYDGKIRQLINGRDKFFAKKEVGNTGYKVLILGENKEKVLNKKYHHPILDEVDNGMNELLEIYSKYPKGKERSHKIELLNTTVKCIVDTQSVDGETIIQAFREWNTPKAEFETKADKFNECEIKNCIDFIISKQWDKKLLN